ncbi:cytochrome P450 4c3 [Ixodes scapularis]|uniref:cytochrome P450 4c3 n=1 Tax=Ixodes scapularis TaxID=6945 RepID=UPI001C383581|nr:cytochrome P450 4c3 [Ixodes scapularis]
MFQWIINEVANASPTGLVLGLSYWALKWSACLCVSFVLLLVCFLSLARRKQLESLKQLEHVAGKREVLPFLNLYIMFKACSQPDNPAGFGPLVFNVFFGFYVCFQKYGMHQEYVGITPTVTIYRADLVEEVLRSNKVITKGLNYKFLRSWLGTGLVTSTGDKWRSRRRLFTPAFHFRILEDFTSTINNQSTILASVLGKTSLEQNGLDVVPKVTLCTLDIICETIMGKTLNAQSNEDSVYVKAVHRLSELFMERMATPLARSESLYRMTAKGKEYTHWLNKLHTFTREVVAERKKDMKATISSGTLLDDEEDNGSNYMKRKRPFLDTLLLEHFKDPQNITEEDMREEVDTFMLAGHDTTAMAISWALLLIGLSPVEQQKIHDELDSIFGDDTERHVNHEDMKEMRYLECALKEAQRIYPSVPFYSRLCEEPFELGGTILPEGTVIKIAGYFLHRDPEVFPKPEEFRPERFLPENSKGRHPFAYIPFSAGPRNCIGQKFALPVVKIVVANILRRYKLQSLDHRDQVLFFSEMVLRPKNGLRIKFIPRVSSKRA